MLGILATAFIHGKQLVQAAELLRQASKFCEWDDFAWSNLAYTLHLQGKSDEAREAQSIAETIQREWMNPTAVEVGGDVLNV